MFEAAEREQAIKRDLRMRMAQENQIKERSDPDITISMSHGDDLNERTDSQRRLQKSRIGGSNMVEIQRDFEKAEGNPYENNDSSLNNNQSLEFQDFLENKYPATSNASELKNYSSDIIMSSKYGQNYMKNQKLKAQERKSNKLSRQIKKDDDKDRQDSANLSQISRQIQERIERKRQEDSQSATHDDTLCSRMTNSFFTNRQHTLKTISKELHQKSKLQVNTNDEPEDDEDSAALSPPKDDAMVDIDRKHNEKLRQDGSELESLKRELQEGTETQHPSKYTQRHGAVSTQSITDVRQNMFMVNMDQSQTYGAHGNRKSNQEPEDSKILDSSRRQNDNSDTRYGSSIHMTDGQAQNRNHEYISQQKIGQRESLKSYEQRGASGSSLGYGGPKGYGCDYLGYGSNNQTSGGYSNQPTSIYQNTQKSSKYNQSQYSSSSYVGNYQGRDSRDYKQGKAAGDSPQGQFYTAPGQQNLNQTFHTRLYNQQSLHSNQQINIGNLDSSSPYSRTGNQLPYQHQSQSFNQRVGSTPYGSPAPPSNKLFYESPSKYISVKKFSEELFHQADGDQASQKKGPKSDTLGDQPVQSIYATSASVQRQLKSSKLELNLRQWFQKLLNHEKAIALTIIDQELVGLIKAMHPFYQDYGHGTYAMAIPTSNQHDQDNYEKVGSFNVIFRKPAFNEQDGFSSDYNRRKSYDYYGSKQVGSGKDKQMKDYQEKLISNIHIINIDGQEAITLSNELLENTEFFMQIMQTIDHQFMGSELKIDKTDVSSAMQGSVFGSAKASGTATHFNKYDNDKQNEGSSQGALRKQGGRSGQTHQRETHNFFTLNERDLTTRVTSSGVNSSEFKARSSQYTNIGIKPYNTPSSISNQKVDKEVVKDKSHMSFGQILSHLFEKSINVQYQEYLGKLSNQMKDFFYMSNENHMYSVDLKLAKFWLNIKPKERDQFWKTISEKQDGILGEIKQTEQYNKLQNCEEITEETETETDSNGNMSFAKFKNKPLKFGKSNNYYKDSNSSFSERRSISEEDGSDSGDHWTQPTSKKKSAQQRRTTKLTRTYVDFDKPDESDEESGDKPGWSRNRSGTDSDDIENQKRNRTQSVANIKQNPYYDQGYRPLENYNEYDSKHSSSKRTILKKPIGSGAKKALDQMSDYDSDRTVTEKSDESDSQNNITKEQCLDDPTAFGTYNDKSGKSKMQDKKQYKAIRGTDNFYNGSERMKAIYSTSMDKEDKSEGEITYNNDDKYDSNYEEEEFEDQDDEDDDDDFALPKNHEQNKASDKQKTQNIKQWIQDNQKKEANEKCQLQLQTTPQYQSTGSQATKDEIAKLAKQKKKAQSKKKKAKKPFEYEETKSENLSKQQLVKTKAQITQNKENQKENQLRKWYKLIITKLQSSAFKKPPSSTSTGKLTANESIDLNSSYLFIRQISTFTGLQNPKQNVSASMIQETLSTKLYQVVYDELNSWFHSRLNMQIDNDLMMADDSNKIKKAAAGGQQKTQATGSLLEKAGTTEAAGSKEANLDGAQILGAQAQGLMLKAGEIGPKNALNQRKKNKRKAKKERELMEQAKDQTSNKEFQQSSQLGDQMEQKSDQSSDNQEQKPDKYDVKTIDKEEEQITEIVQVVDDVVITGIREKPKEQMDLKKEEPQQQVGQNDNEESNDQKKNYRQRKNKKRKKGQKANEEEKETSAQKDGEKDQEEQAEDPTLSVEPNLGSLDLGGEKEEPQDSYQNIVKMLEKLENEDARLRQCEADFLVESKKELFPHGISLGFFSDLQSKSDADLLTSKEMESPQQASHNKENAASLFDQLSELLAKKVGLKEVNGGSAEDVANTVSTRSATKYVEERRGLISGKFHHKYPDDKEIDLTAEFRETISDEVIDQIGRELEEQDDLQIFKADTNPGLRKRTPTEINNAREQLMDKDGKTTTDPSLSIFEENANIISDLNEMNEELKKSDVQELKGKGRPAMKITDLKQQREAEEKMKKFQKTFNSISTDYKERAKDIEMRTDDERKLDDNGEGEGNTKKKKKNKKRNKKKKADAAESQAGDADLPETIAGAESQKKQDNFEWQQEIEKALNEEKHSDDESLRSRHSDCFDDNYYQDDETYQVANEIEKYALIHKTGGQSNHSIQNRRNMENKNYDEDEDILKTDDIDLIMPDPLNEDPETFKVNISKCKNFANNKADEITESKPRNYHELSESFQASSQEKIEEVDVIIDTSNIKANELAGREESKSSAQPPTSSARLITSQSNTSVFQMDPTTNSYLIENQSSQNIQSSFSQDLPTQQYTNTMAKKFIEDCIQSVENNENDMQSKSLKQSDDIQAIANVLGRQQQAQSSSITTSDPVIRLDQNDDAADEGEQSAAQSDTDMQNVLMNQDNDKDNQESTTVSKKKQAKQDKKKEAKQNAKLKKQQIEQQKAELKAQKDQQRKEMMQQKMENKVNEEQKMLEEENLQIEIMKQSLKNLKLPDLKTLNADNVSQNRSSPQTSLVRKKVKFQRDESYDGSKVPKRGSSRGTSMASSNKAKEDHAVNELEELFPIEYTKPPVSTTQSIKDSLNNSKKNSPQCSTNKSQNEGGKTDAEILQRKLDELQKTQNFQFCQISKMRASSLNSEKQMTKRKSSIDSNQKRKGIKINNLMAEPTLPSVEKVNKKNKIKHKNTQDKLMLQQANLTNQKQISQKSQDRKNSMQKAKSIIESASQQTVGLQQISTIPQIQIMKPDIKLAKQERKKLLKEKLKQEKEKQLQNSNAAQGGVQKSSTLQVPDVGKQGSMKEKGGTQQAKKKSASEQNRPDANDAAEQPSSTQTPNASEAGHQSVRQAKKGKVDSQMDKNSDRNSSNKQKQKQQAAAQGEKKSQKTTGKAKEESKQAMAQASYVAKGSQQHHNLGAKSQHTNLILTNQNKNATMGLGDSGLPHHSHHAGPQHQSLPATAAPDAIIARMGAQNDQHQIISSSQQYDQRRNMNADQNQKVPNGKMTQYDQCIPQPNNIKRMINDQANGNSGDVINNIISAAGTGGNSQVDPSLANIPTGAQTGGYTPTDQQHVQQRNADQAAQAANAQQQYQHQFTAASMQFGGRNHQMDNNVASGQVMQLTQNQQPSSVGQSTGGLPQPDQMMMSMMNAAVGSNAGQNNQGDGGAQQQQQQQAQTQIQIDFVRFTVQHGQVPNPTQVVPQQQNQSAVNVQNQQNQVQFMNNWQQQLQQQQQHQQQMQNYMPHQFQAQNVNRSNQNQLQQQQQMQGFIQNMAGLQNNMKGMPNFLNFQNMQNILNQGNLMQNFNPASNMANLNQANIPQNLRNMQNMQNMAGPMSIQPGAASHNGSGLMNFANMGGAMSQPTQNLGMTNINQLGNQFNHQMMPGNQAQGQQANLQQMLMPQNQNLGGQQRLMPNMQQNNVGLQQQNQISSINQNQNSQSYSGNSLGQMMPNLGMSGNQQQFNQQQLNQPQIQRTQQAQGAQQLNSGAPNFGQPFQPFNTQQQQFVPNQPVTQASQQQQLRTSPQQMAFHPHSYLQQNHQQMNNSNPSSQKSPNSPQDALQFSVNPSPAQHPVAANANSQHQAAGVSGQNQQANQASAANNQNSLQQMYYQQMMQMQQQNQQLYQQQQNLINNSSSNSNQYGQSKSVTGSQEQSKNDSADSLGLSPNDDANISAEGINNSNTAEQQISFLGSMPQANSMNTNEQRESLLANRADGATSSNQLLQVSQAQDHMEIGAGQKNEQAVQQQNEMYGKKKRDHNQQQFSQHTAAQLYQGATDQVQDPSQHQHLSSKSANFTPSGNQKQYLQQQNIQNVIGSKNAGDSQSPQYYLPAGQANSQYNPITGIPQTSQQAGTKQNASQLPQLPGQPQQTASALYNNQRNVMSPQQQTRMMQQNQQLQQQPMPPQQFLMNPQQQMIMQKIYQLQLQGYILHQNDVVTLQMLSLQELECVHEFYEVLDAQILHLKSDQESKLLKTQKLRQIAFEMIRDKIKEVYREKYKNRDSKSCDVKVEIYGSMATGLAIDSSDLDILVHDFINQDSPRFQHLSRIELIEEMQELHQALNGVFALKTNSLIESATVPVIKLQMNLVKLCERERERDPDFILSPRNLSNDEDIKTLNIDITLDEPKRKEQKNKGASTLNQHEHLGLQCCKYIKQKLDQYPKMKIIALIFKKFLSLKDLNKPFSGGLSSYSLVQMILAVMKYEEKINMHNKLSVGMIFKHFVYEYAQNFLPLEKGIGQDAQFYDISEFCYIFHTQTCNINVRSNEPDEPDEQSDLQQIQSKSAATVVGSGANTSQLGTSTASSTIKLGKNICTCGYINNSKGQKDGVGGSVSGDSNNPKENQLVNLLQRLLNNNNQQKMLDTGMPESNDYKTRTMQQSHFMQPQLMIIDPLNKFNNIGKSSYNFGMIQQELRDVYNRLNHELTQFVRYASNRKNQQANGISTFGEEQCPPPDIDGLIPRIFDIDFKISQNEPFEDVLMEKGSGLRDAEPFNPTNQGQINSSSTVKSPNTKKDGIALHKQPSSASGGSSGKKAKKSTPTKEEQKAPGVTNPKISSLQQQAKASAVSISSPTIPASSAPQQAQAKTKNQGQNPQGYKTPGQSKKKKGENTQKQANRGRAPYGDK